MCVSRPTFTRVFGTDFLGYILLTLSFLCKSTSYWILSAWEFRFVFTWGTEQDIFLEKLAALCSCSRTFISLHFHPTCLMALLLQMGKLSSGQEEGKGTLQRTCEGRRWHAQVLLHHSHAISLSFAGVWALLRAHNPSTGPRNKVKAEQRDAELQRGYWWVTTAWGLVLINIFINDLG